MPYIVGAGAPFGEPAKSHKIRSAILSCIAGTVIGLGSRLVLDSNPGVIGSMLDALKALGFAIWGMLCNSAQACAEFVNFVIHARS